MCFHCKSRCSEQDGKNLALETSFPLMSLDMFVACCVSDVWWKRGSAVSCLPGEHVCPQLLVLVQVQDFFIINNLHIRCKLPSSSPIVPQYNLIRTLLKKTIIARWRLTEQQKLHSEVWTDIWPNIGLLTIAVYLDVFFFDVSNYF